MVLSLGRSASDSGPEGICIGLFCRRRSSVKLADLTAFLQ